MATIEKIFMDVMLGRKDNNIKFSDLQKLLDVLGFEVHTKGSHNIYSYDGAVELINIQPIGNKAKGYQVKQVRNFILKYGLEV